MSFAVKQRLLWHQHNQGASSFWQCQAHSTSQHIQHSLAIIQECPCDHGVLDVAVD
jgi:hypothetical protein